MLAWRDGLHEEAILYIECNLANQDRFKELRSEFLREHRSLTLADLAGLVDADTRISIPVVEAWALRGEIFSVQEGGIELHPAFQIDPRGLKPFPEIREALGHLRMEMNDWQVVLWFAGANAWTCDWRRPLDLLGS